ncbi:MAG: manganese efflux pump [Candidatus Eremiobacteraeota bacterium]|nr:manganese efflux pump [Candidatus Eremiobacteraeota bacterium]MBC5804558.1 manganese efflux pump [Candidatus Eremiobacteraeota bacterium]MBC5822882.1 manganese efflux pump [Candidatus Eremiobacteraeota bacterium]
MINDAAHIAAFVVPLALDTLALAIVVGLRGGVAPLRVAVVCGLFEGTMPAVGAALALIVPARYGSYAVYLGSAILTAVGVHALREVSQGEEEAEAVSFGSIRSMVLAGFAISTDELAVGFPLAASGLPVMTTLVVVAAQAFIVAYVGVAFGRRLGRAAAKYAGIGAGFAFIVLGMLLAFEHMRSIVRS